MDIKTFKREAVRVFKKSNPSDTRITWVMEPEHITYPTGLQGWRGRFTAEAKGFRTRTLTATFDEGDWMVR